MFKEIKGKEIVIMARTIKNGYYDEESGEFIEGKTTEETLELMELIDDLLLIMKSKSLLNKKRGLKRILSGRIEMATNYNSIRPGANNPQLGKI